MKCQNCKKKAKKERFCQWKYCEDCLKALNYEALKKELQKFVDKMRSDE